MKYLNSYITEKLKLNDNTEIEETAESLIDDFVNTYKLEFSESGEREGKIFYTYFADKDFRQLWNSHILDKRFSELDKYEDELLNLFKLDIHQTRIVAGYSGIRTSQKSYIRIYKSNTSLCLAEISLDDYEFTIIANKKDFKQYMPILIKSANYILEK